MWWYNRLNIRLSGKEDDLEVIINAEKIIRRRLYYQGNSNPSMKEIHSLMNKVVDNLKQKFGNLNKIRRASPTQSINPIIEEAVREILP